MSKYQPKQLVKVLLKGSKAYYVGTIVEYSETRDVDMAYAVELGFEDIIFVGEEVIRDYDEEEVPLIGELNPNVGCAYCCEEGAIVILAEDDDEDVDIHIYPNGKLRVWDNLRTMYTGVFIIHYCPSCGRKLGGKK